MSTTPTVERYPGIAQAAPVSPGPGLKLTFAFLSAFVFVYFSRPSDWTPALAAVPFAMVTGMLTFASFGLAVLNHKSVPLGFEGKLLAALTLHLALAIPFAFWPGGSFQLFSDVMWKALVLTIIILQCVNTLDRLKLLLFIQTTSFLVAAVIAVNSGNFAARDGRLVGLGGNFQNSNDFAQSLAIVFPMAAAFMLRSRAFMKLVWAALMLLSVYAISLTYSRAGFLALVIGISAFAVVTPSQKQTRFVLLGGMLLLCIVGVIAAPAEYQDRLKTIFEHDADTTGSAQDRRELALTAIQVTLKNPIFGIGPGNFTAFSGNWQVSHNTYLQLSSEAGLPALILFLLLLRSAFKRLREAQHLARAEDLPDLNLWAGALRASLASYCICAFFASTAYQFFTYFLIGYAVAMAKITHATVQAAKQRRDAVLEVVPAAAEA
jgi:O-antigen ligase